MPNTAEQHKYRALGIDPGLAATGYAVIGSFSKGGEVCSAGSIKTAPRHSVPLRLQQIYREMSTLIETWLPQLIVVEDVYVLDKFPKAAIQLGEVRGVIYLAAQERAVEILSIRPTVVKSCLAGNGRATKQQVSRSVKRVLGLSREITPDHASDAAALALIGMSRKGFISW
ncbi:crossover junction endodeoxyribonuclease RuvC [Thermodesulfobacteriota bacterium]